jgi:hypothetical protein
VQREAGLEVSFYRTEAGRGEGAVRYWIEVGGRQPLKLGGARWVMVAGEEGARRRVGATMH